jgi:hypothetical protein
MKYAARASNFPAVGAIKSIRQSPGAGPSPFSRALFREPNQKGRLQSHATRPIVTRIADRLGYPAQSPVSSSTCRRAAPGRQGKHQSDFAGEPLVAPIKAYLTFELG